MSITRIFKNIEIILSIKIIINKSSKKSYFFIFKNLNKMDGSKCWIS